MISMTDDYNHSVFNGQQGITCGSRLISGRHQLMGMEHLGSLTEDVTSQLPVSLPSGETMTEAILICNQAGVLLDELPSNAVVCPRHCKTASIPVIL